MTPFMPEYQYLRTPLYFRLAPERRDLRPLLVRDLRPVGVDSVRPSPEVALHPLGHLVVCNTFAASRIGPKSASWRNARNADDSISDRRPIVWICERE
jgi:hypothetical protein